jgi:hypothetical protein
MLTVGFDVRRKRALAEDLNGDQAKVAMLRVADEYDKLARRAEEREATRTRRRPSSTSSTSSDG